MSLQRDAIPLRFAARQGDDFKYRFVDVEPVLLRRSFLGEGANAADDFAGSMAVGDDERRRLPGFLQVGSWAASQRKQALALLTIAASGWLISWAIEAVISPRVATRVTWASSACACSQGLFGLFALGDVKQGAHQSHHRAVGVPDRFTHALHEAHGTIGTVDAAFEIIKLPLMDGLIVAFKGIGEVFWMHDVVDEVLAR